MFDRADAKQEAQGQSSGPVNFDIYMIPGLKTFEKHFDSMFRSSISYVFFTMGRDHYSKFTKVTLFVLLILVPGLLAIFLGGAGKLLDIVDSEDEPTPFLNQQAHFPNAVQ